MHVRRRARGVTLAVTAALGLLVAMLSGTPAGAGVARTAGAAAVPSPDVTEASGGRGVPVIPGFTQFDLSEVGYQMSEVFLSGTAHAYQPTAALTTDGRFSVVESAEAPYTTRAVVARPTRPSKFNGTVVVEWLNVSGGADAGPDWILAHNELVREGFVWVGVSAQKVGVDALRSDDPQRGDAVRYAGLDHPGDSFSYDMFSQAGQAIRDNADTILGGLHAPAPARRWASRSRPAGW